MATEPTVTARVNKLREELAEFSTLNREYHHINHTVEMRVAHEGRTSADRH
jgi:hypothetical protein